MQIFGGKFPTSGESFLDVYYECKYSTILSVHTMNHRTERLLLEADRPHAHDTCLLRHGHGTLVKNEIAVDGQILTEQWKNNWV